MEKSQAAPCRPATTSSARERRIPGRGAGGVAVCTFAVLCGGACAMESGVICHATDALLTTVFELLSAETKNVYLREFWANVQSNASTDRHLGTCARFCSALYDRVVRMGEVRQCVRVIGVLESARAGDSDAMALTFVWMPTHARRPTYCGATRTLCSGSLYTRRAAAW